MSNSNEEVRQGAEEASSNSISQADRAKQLLAARKQQQGMPGKSQQSTGTKKLVSQNTKRVNNQRKKMGV